MKVEDFMNKQPASISPNASLALALEQMAEKKTRHLVVIAEGGNIAGILSDRDLAMYYDPEKMTQERWDNARVGDLMSADPISIGSHAPIQEAAKLLIRLSVSALPVVDNGQLNGILSEKEFVRHFSK